MKRKKWLSAFLALCITFGVVFIFPFWNSSTADSKNFSAYPPPGTPYKIQNYSLPYSLSLPIIDQAPSPPPSPPPYSISRYMGTVDWSTLWDMGCYQGNAGLPDIVVVLLFGAP